MDTSFDARTSNNSDLESYHFGYNTERSHHLTMTLHQVNIKDGCPKEHHRHQCVHLIPLTKN
jgi:hypothetical protein